VITSNFWPEQTGSSQTVGEFADYLARQGLDVRVATAMPFYPQWRIWPEYRGALHRVEARGRMTVFRSWHWVSPRPSTLTRILHESTLALFALPNMVRTLRRARVAYVVSPALTYAFVGLAMAWLMGVRRVLVVKDVMPDAAIELGMLRNSVLVALSRRLAKWAYAMADEIHTLGEGMRWRIAQMCEQVGKIRIVPDTVDVAELRSVPYERNEFRKQFVPSGVFAVLHTGNMGKKQDLGIVLRAANRLRNEDDVRFYVVGDGAEKDSFLRQRDAMGLGNVVYYPLQPRSMVPHMLSGADVVIVSQVAEVVDIVVPSKLITAMACGAMIVAACSPGSEAERLVREAGGGVVVAAGDDGAMVEVINRVRQRSMDVQGHRDRVRQFASDRFSREAIYGGELRRLVAESAVRGGDFHASDLQVLRDRVEEGVER